MDTTVVNSSIMTTPNVILRARPITDASQLTEGVWAFGTIICRGDTGDSSGFDVDRCIKHIMNVLECHQENSEVA